MSQQSQIDISSAWLVRQGDESGKKRQSDHRSPFQRDRARILHSAAFRRLQAKTQVVSTGVNDFYRTRLTHSLEAAQIGSGIVAQLKQKQGQLAHLLPSNSLIEAICLSHDIGHPPYGHGGEVALNYMMRQHGGFEGNGQTLRIVTKLEPYTPDHGMNLTRRTLLGLLKYPAKLSQLTMVKKQVDTTPSFRQLKASEWSPAKGIYDDDDDVLTWLLAPLDEQDKAHFTQVYQPNPNSHLKTLHKSLDCSIMELADDIAYGIHDLEDAITMGLVTKKQWQEEVASKLVDIDGFWLAKVIPDLTEQLFSDQHYQRKDAIGAMVNALITSVKLGTVETDFHDPLLKYNARLTPAMEQVLTILKQFVLHFVILQTNLQIHEYKGQQIIMELFEAFAADPERLLPNDTKTRWLKRTAAGHTGNRIITDYISGMTDGHAVRLHNQLFNS
ncbi:anti-phage deoxyguanosine triphosphatase [Motilimonas pumila]|uniref:Deoxyguanosinetriphosphate triphosphohydrolase-like protein n=1 Tax=Motilimonas pumila TaxID=2303987 RepID=A0A418YCF6_9GAMM|nr:anti-phage deoxyguanosine triphosphatase [Motilimonas pumila]RJG42155.1 deoxyguanosinetriphosphate triphosphohydrolase family protein [Motilimonas pumila]